MGKPYSDDLRERSCRETGALFGIAPSTAGNWRRLQKATQSEVVPPSWTGWRRS